MIYLDNAATTKPSQTALEAVIATAESFGNPSSLHKIGLNAEKIVKSSAKTLSGVIGAKPENIIFTSGGTESNNTAMFGAVKHTRKKKLITTAVEHPSVAEPMKALEGKGYELDIIPVDEDGIICLDALADALSEDTALVSVMHVNNETGSVQPVEKIKELIEQKARGAMYHIDAVQSFSKLPLNVTRLGADFMSLSAHKINAFKGCGALYVKNKSSIEPHICGGGQQWNLRSGTENVPGIAAFGAAAKEHLQDEYDKIAGLRKRLKDGILDNIPDTVYNGSATSFSPYILNVSFLGIKAEILLHSLESEGIFVSTGSACSSNKPMPSRVLTAMGKSSAEIGGAVRFSFDSGISCEDIDFVLEVLAKQVAEIRKYMR